MHFFPQLQTVRASLIIGNEKMYQLVTARKGSEVTLSGPNRRQDNREQCTGVKGDGAEPIADGNAVPLELVMSNA